MTGVSTIDSPVSIREAAGLQADGSKVIKDKFSFLSGNAAVTTSAGTWTKTRVAAGDMVLRHTAAADTTILTFEIPNGSRTTALRGYKLTSIDVVFNLGTADLVAHSLAVYTASYTNSGARVITSVPTTGALSITNTSSADTVSTATVTTPAFNTTADQTLRLELTVQAALTSAYDLVGFFLHYTTNDL